MPDYTWIQTVLEKWGAKNKAYDSDVDGVFDTGAIPNLDASKITSGVFDLARIPTIPATKIVSEFGMTINRVMGRNDSDTTWTTVVDYTGSGILVGYWFHFPHQDGVRLRITIDGEIYEDFTSDSSTINYAYYENSVDDDIGFLCNVVFKRFDSSLKVEILSGVANKAAGITVVYLT